MDLNGAGVCDDVLLSIAGCSKFLLPMLCAAQLLYLLAPVIRYVACMFVLLARYW